MGWLTPVKGGRNNWCCLRDSVFCQESTVSEKDLATNEESFKPTQSIPKQSTMHLKCPMWLCIGAMESIRAHLGMCIHPLSYLNQLVESSRCSDICLHHFASWDTRSFQGTTFRRSNYQQPVQHCGTHFKDRTALGKVDTRAEERTISRTSAWH